MITETKRMRFRPWRDEDAESLYRYAKDPKVGPAAGWLPHTSVSESLEIIRNILSQKGTHAITLKENDEAIGCISLRLSSNIPLGENEGEIGYWLGAPFWGKGLITEAVQELIRYGFEEAGLETIYCLYYEGNEKSHRVQEKCGFRHVKTIKDFPVPLLSGVRTLYVNRIIRQEWENDCKKREAE